MNRTQEGGGGTLRFTANWSEVWGTTWAFQRHLKLGGNSLVGLSPQRVDSDAVSTLCQNRVEL